VRTQQAIEKFLSNRQARNLKPSSIQHYQNLLTKFAQFYPELPTDPEPIEAFLTSLNIAPETRLTYYAIIKAFYHFLFQRRYVSSDPMTQISRPRCTSKVMPTLEPEQTMRLLNAAHSLRDRALLTLFVDTGIRASEAASLRQQDIKVDCIKLTGKTGERQVPMSDETSRLLSALITANIKSDYVFISHKGHPLDGRGIYCIVHKLMKEAGIQGPKLGPHRIRHAFGKGYIVSGGDIRSLQQIMGHAKITTTEKYAALNLKDITAKHHKFTPLRAAHAAAQEVLFKDEAIKEAEAIINNNARR